MVERILRISSLTSVLVCWLCCCCWSNLLHQASSWSMDLPTTKTATIRRRMIQQNRSQKHLSSVGAISSTSLAASETKRNECISSLSYDGCNQANDRMTTATSGFMQLPSSQSQLSGESLSSSMGSRRSFLSFSVALATSVVAGTAAAAAADTATISQSSPSTSSTVELRSSGDEGNRIKLRNRLLQLISSKSTREEEAEILDTIQQLQQYDPTKGQAATKTYNSDLDGEWKLIWSIKADAFSPLLKLPPPFRPMSYQYLGEAAASEVGPDRVAQGLTGGLLVGQSQVWLSSGVRNNVDNNGDDPSTLDILPPFRLQYGGRYRSNKPKTTIVEAGSDAEFRKLNARTSEAQAAPKNSYKQLYVERGGKGSLRISTITDGDPVIIGAMFIHEKM
mmetsp:Transcript_21947/g.51750  ORF Transcript_21947/g.51750 Transcript_21947/m.51750 type:complete len:393 (+) Transcript_21947:84-1262(+)